MKSLAFVGIESIFEESYEALLDDDYITGHHQFRYPGGLPRRCLLYRARWGKQIIQSVAGLWGGVWQKDQANRYRNAV